MHTTMPRRVALALTAITFTVAAAGCGSDDDESAATTANAVATTAAGAAPTSAAEATTASTSGGSAAGGDVDAFCAAELDVEAAVAAEDPEAIGAAFEALSVAAPEDVKGSVDTAIAEAQEFLAADGEPTEEFNTAYSEVLQYMKGNCGYTDLSVTATDYAFQGLQPEIAAGPAVITFQNNGQEAHELAIMRVNDGVTESVDELLALPEEEAMAKFDPSAGGGTFALPGGTNYTAVDLVPGRYIVSCFVPQGMTMEAMEEMETTGSEPQGTPHAMLGMIQEVTVS